MSLRARRFLIRFVLIFAASAIPLFVSELVSFNSTPDLAFNAQRTAREIDRLLELRMRQVFTFAALPSIRAFAASDPATRAQRAAVALNELRAWVAADTQVREAFIVDRSALVIMTTGEEWGSSLITRQFVRDALAGHVAISPVSHERGEISTYYAAPVLDNAGNIAGALVGRLAVQELWSTVGKGENWHTLLVDENGVRLEDTSDPAMRLVALGTVNATQGQQMVNEQIYGAQQTLVRAGDWARAQELAARGTLAQLQPRDVGAEVIAVQSLVNKPWSVVVIQPHALLGEFIRRLALPIATGFILSLISSLVLARLS